MEYHGETRDAERIFPHEADRLGTLTLFGEVCPFCFRLGTSGYIWQVKIPGQGIVCLKNRKEKDKNGKEVSLHWQNKRCICAGQW